MYVSMRDAILHWAGFPSLAEGLRATGCTAFELALDRDMSCFSPEYSFEDKVRLDTPEAIAAYKHALDQAGFRVSALLLGNDFSRADLDAEIDWVVRCARVGDALGADAVRIDAWMNPDDPSAWPLDRRIDVFVDSMKKVLKATEGTRPEFGIENHGWPGNDPEFLTRIISAVGSNRLGSTLDTANFYWSGMPLSEVHAVIKRLAPLAKHTHAKNINFPADVRETQRERGWGYDKYSCVVQDGDIDMRKVVDWLRDAGYKSDLCVENEAIGRYEPAERQQMLKSEAEFLRSLL